MRQHLDMTHSRKNTNFHLQRKLETAPGGVANLQNVFPCNFCHISNSNPNPYSETKGHTKNRLTAPWNTMLVL